jgi:uncharacterized membrane protein
MNNSKLVKRLALTGIVAGVYTVMSMFFPLLAYGQIQCRISEVLNLLAFVNPIFAPGIILGCFLTNLFSPFPFDWLFGTLATCAAMFFITRSKNLITASLWPTVFMFAVGAQVMLYIPEIEIGFMSFIVTTLGCMAGEFVAMTLIGVPVFRYLIRNERLMRYLKGL